MLRRNIHQNENMRAFLGQYLIPTRVTDTGMSFDKFVILSSSKVKKT